MAAWRYEISLLVLKIFHSFAALSRSSLVKYFSTLEEKFRISARPCNILYLSCDFQMYIGDVATLLAIDSFHSDVIKS